LAELVTLSYVKRYVQPDSEEDDQILADLIRYASGLIRTFTERRLTRPPVTEERTLYWTGRRSGRLDDKLSDVTEIVAPYPYERALTASEYELEQFPTVSVLTVDQPVEGKLLVSGTWGWDQLPGDIQYATIATVDEWYRGNALAPIHGREEGEPEGANIYLPLEVQQILTPWQHRQLIA
jgi:hypothetical protein